MLVATSSSPIEDIAFLDVVKIRRVRDGKNLTSMFKDAITGADLEMTLEGAGTLTLTINDPDWVILTSGVFDRLPRKKKDKDKLDSEIELDAIDVKIDHRWYRIMQVQAQGSALTLTCEEREVVYLRKHRKLHGKGKWNRSKHTRAEFVKHLVKTVEAGGGIDFFSPELHKKQPIARRYSDNG